MGVLTTMNQTTSSAVQKQRQLDAFLVDNRELEALNARLANFNLFRVLRIEKAEIRHSNVLAWLLTPGETHGLGDLFLRRFLSRLLMENDELDVSLSPAQIELMSLGDVEVEREWQNIDILVQCRSGEWCLIIENKILSKERVGQLLKYKKKVRETSPSLQIIPVYLTVEGDEPSEEGKKAGFVPWSHAQVLELADAIIEQNCARIPGDASTFLKHYLDVLRRLTMQDEELSDLCKTIYRKHRDAIDLIVEYGASSQVTESCQERLQSLVECEFIKPAHSRLFFLPKEMGRHQPDVGLAGWQFLPRHVAVACWFFFGKKTGKLHAVMEVGPVSDGSVRRRLLEAVKNAGFSFSEKAAFKEGAKFTRIVSKIQRLRTNEDGEPDDDPEYIQDVTGSLWEKMWGEGQKIMQVLKDFDWKE